MWEYKIIDIEESASEWQEEDFNKLGRDDWELVCVNDKYAYFTRFISSTELSEMNQVYSEFEQYFTSN